MQVNHAQNLGLSIFTLGIWLPIWFFMAFSKTKTCDKCGESLTEE
jgi:hypothetical protein